MRAQIVLLELTRFPELLRVLAAVLERRILLLTELPLRLALSVDQALTLTLTGHRATNVLEERAILDRTAIVSRSVLRVLLGPTLFPEPRRAQTVLLER